MLPLPGTAAKMLPWMCAAGTAQNPGGRFVALHADVSDSAQVNAAVQEALQQFGSLQALICCAGIAQQKLFTDLTDEDWHRMMGVDLDGVFYACRAVLPGMIRQKYGRILLVSSMWGGLFRQGSFVLCGKAGHHVGFNHTGSHAVYRNAGRTFLFG